MTAPTLKRHGVIAVRTRGSNTLQHQDSSADGAMPRPRAQTLQRPQRNDSTPAFEPANTPMRVMLVDDDHDRLRLLREALVGSGNEVVAELATSSDLLTAVNRHQPDVVLIDVDAPSRDTLESLGQIARDRPRPIVLFAANSDAETIRRAMRAGVSAYVVDGMSASRLKSVIDVAIARFHEHQALKRELEDTKTRLADRRDIDRAKGVLMQRRGLSENDAYELLRRMAMDRNLKRGDAARALLAAADLI